MFSRIERCALAAIMVACGCSGGGDQRLATIHRDAAVVPPDVVPCTPQTITAKDVGLDFYFIVEHSEDIDDRTWPALVSNIHGLFFIIPDASSYQGIGLGVAFYPVMAPPPPECDACASQPNSCFCLRNCGCEHFLPTQQGTCACTGPTSCDVAEYTTPNFEIERISEPDQSTALLTALWGSPVFIGHPAIRTALEASLAHRNQWELENEGRHIIQVLIATNPSRADCDHSLSDAVRVLSGAGKPTTYVVTVNDFGEDLDPLVSAVPTLPTAFNAYRNTENPFVDIVEDARIREGRCEYVLPKTAALDKVNLLAPDGSIVPRVKDRKACARGAAGWFFDPTERRRIVTCEDTCNTVFRPAERGAADIQLGCATVTAPDGGL
jgi:hypothetical protein